nr:MAG TPA: hypothetical protein [Caudoviricetes sp.]
MRRNGMAEKRVAKAKQDNEARRLDVRSKGMALTALIRGGVAQRRDAKQRQSTACR